MLCPYQPLDPAFLPVDCGGSRLKSLRFFLPIILLLTATSSLADRPDSGLFLGAATRIQYMTGTGSWDGLSFAIDEPPRNDGSTSGFGWEEKLLLGGAPSLGYYINETLSLQCTFGLNFTKAASQSVTEVTDLYVERSGYNSEWTQRSLELVMSFHSSSDLAYFLFGGTSLIQVKQKNTTFGGREFTDPFGGTYFEGHTDISTDDFSTLGFLFGAGFEFPTGGNNRIFYVAAQYEVATSNTNFHGTPDFRVDVGGVTVMLGLKWFPFQD